MIEQKTKKNLTQVICTALLTGCAASKNEENVSTQVSVQTNQPSLEHTLNKCYFATFDPPNAEHFINLDGHTAPFIIDGLDAELQLERKNTVIENYIAFENKIYSIAEEFGQSREAVDTLAPKQTIELTCKIIAHRMNYFGKSSDYFTKKQQQAEKEYIKKIFTNMLNDQEVAEGEKKEAIEGIKLVEDLVEEQKKIEDLETQLSKLGGLATYYAGFNRSSSSELFIQNKPIVCTQYALIAKDVFFVLKQNNPRLRNTYVAVYRDGNHVWNQATTLYEKEGKMNVDVTFFDPTWYDTGNIMEGYTKLHFKNYLFLQGQFEKLEKALAITFPKKPEEKITALKQ